MIYCNTTSKHSTHFLAPVHLIKNARQEFNVASENWPYPTVHRFGSPRDKYYAEVWEDGMDWQNSYWLIEANNYEDPVCMPLLIFDDHTNLDKFNMYDLSQLFQAVLYYRRDRLWIKQNDLGIFSDEVWPYLTKIETDEKKSGLTRFYFEHASQKRTEFWLNAKFIPIYKENKK